MLCLSPAVVSIEVLISEKVRTIEPSLIEFSRMSQAKIEYTWAETQEDVYAGCNNTYVYFVTSK